MKITAIGLGQFLLVLMACSVVQIICSTSYGGNEKDRLSLLEFKNAIRLDPQEALMSWNESTHFCSWKGVHCSMKNPRRVISLNLTNKGLVGQISPSLGNLTFLKFLLLPENSFTGEIPLSLSHLHRLQIIFLSKNTLQGRIPNLANCSNLKVLWVNGNNLVGQIPADLPHGFQTLQLSINNLTGTIPVSLANITTLKRLSCVYNNIEGNIPNEFAKLPGLQFLHMGINNLVGSFPHALLNLSTLMELSLPINILSGDIPSSLGNSLSNLRVLDLGGNFFHGHIPFSLTNASELKFFDISNNSFTGVVPSSIGKLTKLSWLNVEINKIHARTQQDLEFINSLANCTELQVFSVEDNHLEGHLPNSFGNYSTQLQYVHMGSNQLSGGFPTSIANLPSLILLSMHDNRFTGLLPNCLGALKNMQELHLSYNMFTGSIPSSISNLSHLVKLYLGSNQIDGHISPSLGNLQMLETLSISNNNLHGTVPPKIFNIPTIISISLAFNHLDGKLPSEVGNAKQLMILLLSSNNLSGDIPNNLGNCESLESIELGHNTFGGSIPTSLGNVSSLKVLNLSHNNLIGTIPTSLGNLQLLQQLDVSFNHLKGEVPAKGIFKNATAIQIEGNQALCGGAPELHLLECSVMPTNSNKHKHSIVLKVVIPLASMVSLVVVISALFIWRGKHKRKSISLPSFDSKFPKVSYNDLANATDGFSTSKLIGRGRYSFVYQGKLFDDTEVVAIKVFSLQTRGAQKSFIAECNALKSVRHRNLVPILTACSSIDAKGNDFKALVYEFMPRGDLHVLLYSSRDDENTSAPNHITLAQRLNVVVDVADALDYLHHNNQGTIVHCDLKPSNILLDDNMTAHVGDFGLALFKVDSTSSSSGNSSYSTSSLALKGTIGYVAPECAGGHQVSTASDVYSFGVVLLEMCIRKRPTHDMFTDGLNIAKFTEMNFPDNILQIVDPQLLQELVLCHETTLAVKEKGVDCLLSMLNVGLCCTKTSTRERFSMQEAAAKLHGVKDAYLRGTE